MKGVATTVVVLASLCPGARARSGTCTSVSLAALVAGVPRTSYAITVVARVSPWSKQLNVGLTSPGTHDSSSVVLWARLDLVKGVAITVSWSPLSASADSGGVTSDGLPSLPRVKWGGLKAMAWPRSDTVKAGAPS